MKDLGFIRDYFRPIQPSVNAASNPVSYLDVAPTIELSSFIATGSLIQAKIYRHFGIKDPNGVGIDLVKYSAP